MLARMENPTFLWLCFGVVLMISEFVVPGLIVVFLGVAAVLVAGAQHLGWVSELPNALLLWFLLSLGMVLFLRSFLEALLPGETERTSTDEDADTFGSLVSVVAECGVGEGNGGRIVLHGVEWPAQVTGIPGQPNRSIKQGAAAEIVGRENLTWLIEPISAQEKEHS